MMNEAYAVQIARDWNVRDSGAGFVTRFELDAAFARRYPVHTVGASFHGKIGTRRHEIACFQMLTSAGNY